MAKEKKKSSSSSAARQFVSSAIQSGYFDKFNKQPLMEKKEPEDVTRTMPLLNPKHVEQANAKFDEDKAFGDNVYKEIADSYQKNGGNTSLFRDSLIVNDGKFQRNYKGESKSAPIIHRNITKNVYASSLLQDLQKNPTLDNYRKFVDTYDRFAPQYASTYNGFDTLALASSIMYKNNKDFKLDDDIYARRLFAEDDKELRDLKKNIDDSENWLDYYEENSGSWYDNIIDVPIQLGAFIGFRDEADAATKRIKSRSANSNKATSEEEKLNLYMDEYSEKSSNLLYNKILYWASMQPDFEEKSDFSKINVQLPLGAGSDEEAAFQRDIVFIQNGRKVSEIGLTEEETQNLWYFLNKFGYDSAYTYYKKLYPIKNARMAKATSDWLQEAENGGFWSALGSYTLQGLTALGSGIEGIVQAGGSAIDSINPFSSTTEYEPTMNQLITAYNKENAGGLGRTALSVVEGVPQVAGVILTSKINPSAGKAFLATTAYGSAYADAINNGYSTNEARGVGVAMAGLELFAENIGGITTGGKGTASIGKKLLSKTDDIFKHSPKLRAVSAVSGKAIGTFASEGFEGYFSSTFEPVVKNIMLGEDNEFKLYSDEQLEAAVIEGLTGFVASSPTFISSTAKTFKPGNYGAQEAFYINASDSVLEAEMLKANPGAFKGLDSNGKETAIGEYRMQKINEAAFDSIYGHVASGVLENLSLSDITSAIASEGIKVSDYLDVINTAYQAAYASSGPEARITSFIEAQAAKGGTAGSITDDIISSGNLTRGIKEFDGLEGDALKNAVKKYVYKVQKNSPFINELSGLIQSGESNYAIIDELASKGTEYTRTFRNSDGALDVNVAYDVVSNARLKAISKQAADKKLTGQAAIKFTTEALSKENELDRAYLYGKNGRSLDEAIELESKSADVKLISDSEFEKAFNKGKVVFEESKKVSDKLSEAAKADNTSEGTDGAVNAESPLTAANTANTATSKSSVSPLEFTIDNIVGNVISEFSEKAHTNVDKDSISRVISDALTRSGDTDVPFIISGLSEVFTASMNKQSSAYLALAQNGESPASVLSEFILNGTVPEGVSSKAVSAVGNIFKAIAQDTVKRVESGRKALFSSSVTESASGNINTSTERNLAVEQADGGITVLSSGDIYSVFENSKAIIIGKDIITDKKVGVLKTQEFLNSFKKAENAVITEDDSISFDRLFFKNNDVIISGNPKVFLDESASQYCFEIEGRYFVCSQKALDAFANGGNIIRANTNERIPWTVTSRDGKPIGVIMPKSTQNITKEQVDALPFASDIIKNSAKLTDSVKSVPGNENIKDEVQKLVNEKSFEDVIEDTKNSMNESSGKKFVFDSREDSSNEENVVTSDKETVNSENEEKTSEIISEQNEADDITKEAVKKTNEENISVSEETSVLEKRAVETEKADENKSSDNNDALELTDKCELIATKHTQTGDDIYVITVKDRLSKEQYNELNQKVKAVGGYYSRFAKTPDGKAIPGFIFKSEPDADVFKVFNEFFGESARKTSDTPYNIESAEDGFLQAIDTDMLSFIDKALQNDSDSKSTYVIGKTTNKLNREIQNLTGIDTTLFKHYVKANSIRHIIKDHGENGLADHTMANHEDIARMGYVLNKFDNIELLDSTSKEYRDNNQKPAPMIKLSKRVDGTYYVIEAVPDTKAKSLAVVSAYMKKAATQQTENVQAFSSNVRDDSADIATFNDNISQKNDFVNSQNNTEEETLTENSNDDTIEEKTDVEDDTNDREQQGILAAEGEGHITGEQSEEIQDDEEGRDIGGSDGDSGTVGTDEVSDDTRVVDTEQDTSEGVRDAEPDTGHDFNGESGEHTDSERESDTGSDVSSRRLNTHNYRITEDIDSARPSISDNLEAIKVLKELEKSGKKPTKAQQAILAKYKGWGGLKSAFTDYYNIRQLREVMTEEEFKAARAGVLDAFYTSTKLIGGIYKGLSRLGFKGGNILEPSMGTGNFFGVMPAGISGKSNLYGVELDSLTGRIAKYLYPDASIEISGFQDVKYPEGTFDAVVGNVPFVDVSTPYKGSKYMLHDYFFIKSLDTLKEGGVLAVLTSTGTLDKLNTKARHEMAKRANLIAAYRLPNDAFATNAGTSVTTDLIILQKRGDTIPFNGEAFEHLGKIGNTVINEYFASHPENILGELSVDTDMYGKEKSVVKPFEGKDFAKVFDKAISRLPKDLLSGIENQAPVDIQVLNASKSHFEERNGDVIFFDSDTGAVDVLSGKAKERAKAYIAVKDAYNNLLEASKAGVSKLERDALRSILNKAYDDFHAKHGNLQDKTNKSLEADSEFIKVTGIELYNPDKKAYEKSGIFTVDTIGYIKPVKADTPLDALAISINESGRVDLNRISALVGKSVEDTISELEGSIIETPDGEYELIPIYASGNIREKLKAVEGKEGFERNVELLKAVMPKDKAPSEIVPQFGASWIPEKYISHFIRDVFGMSYSNVQVNYDPTSGTWSIEKFWSDRHTMTQKFGTSRLSAYDLLVDTINMKSAKVYDTIDDKRYFNKKETSLARQKQAEITEAFSNWIFKDADRRSDLVKIYNELFNSHRNMDYAELSKYLTFPGLKSSWHMRDYQKAAVARVIFGGDTLLAHGVGTGKTCEMIASAMEMKRMGITKKNVFVVPKHKIGDFRNDILKMYPEAKVLMATEKDFEKKNRGKLFSKIGTNDWDIVIIGHTSFGLLPVSSQTEAAYIEKQKNELEDVINRTREENGRNIDKRFVSGLEKSLKSLEARLKEALDTKKDDTITFEELGIDGLFVDEAHNFKNLPFYTKLNLPGVKGGTSKRASDMFMKTEYLRDQGGRIVFATATPITNSVSEFYNMTRFVRPDALKEAGIYSFDSWASTFGSIETKMEMSPDGKNYRTKERFSKYNNVREMVGLFRQFADILRTGDVVKDLPKANYIDVISPSLDFHDQYINNIIERMKRVSSGGQSREDNMLLITNDGRAMATDLRLIASQIENFTDEELDVPTSRINKAISNIITEYKKSDKIKGTQFVFLDFGMNANDEGRYNYNLYGDLISKLVEGGIPENEIAKIGDYDTVAKKDALFKKVNDGEVRVLIGSTAKMGEGMNAQERAVALHHLNAPYRPSDIEQREGRIIRHGNINKDVNIYRYIQEKSFDSYMWQMLARKGEFINQALSDGDISELEETDEFVLSAKQGMAVATGNPLILKKVEVDEEVKRLQGLKKSYDASIYDMQDRLAKLPGEIEATKLALSRTKEDIKTLEANNSEDFSIKLAGKVYDKRADAAKALVPLIKNKYGATGSEVIGVYRGLNLTLTKSYAGGILYIGNKSSMKVELSDSAEGNITRITNAASRFGSYAEFLSKRVTTLKSELKSIKNDIDLPFKYQSQLDKAIAEQADIDSQLNFGEDNSEVVEDMNDKFDEDEEELLPNIADEEDLVYEEIFRRESLRDSNKREWGKIYNPYRQNRGFQEGRGTSQERTLEERKRIGQKIVKQKGLEKIQVLSFDFDVVKKDFYNEEMNAISKFNEMFGVQTEFYLGTKEIKGIECEAVTDGKELILLSYDFDKSPWDANAHELSHVNINRNFEQLLVIKSIVQSRLKENNIDILKYKRYQEYLSYYDGNFDCVLNEFICDIMSASKNDGRAKPFTDLVQAFWNANFEYIENYSSRVNTNSKTLWKNKSYFDEDFYPSLDDDGEYDFGDIWKEDIEKYGAIQQGENPVRDISVPRKISKTQYVSRFARTMMEAGVTPDDAMSEFEEKILDGTMTHEVITNDAARQKAISEIKRDGFEESLTKWQGAIESGSVSKYTMVKGQELYNQCITNKDVTNAMKIAADLTSLATHAGQTLQACRVLKLMSPDGQLYYLEKSVDKMNEEFKNVLRDKFEDIELNEELMREFLTAENDESRSDAYDKLCQDIADQIPSTFRDKWNSWRYLAMLGNPRTHVRNFVGNAVFFPAIRIKNHIAAVLERVSKVPMENRLRSHYKTKEAKKFAKDDFEKVRKQLQGENGKYAFNGDISERRTIFKTKLLETLRRKNFDILEWEDMKFLKRHYIDTLARVITARKLDVNSLDGQVLDEIRLFAIRQAQEYTYRDANALAAELNRIERTMSTSKKASVRAASVLLEGVMPFKKTPLNIAKQGIMYSPVGIISGTSKALSKLRRNGELSASEVIDDLSKGLTGTGIMALGMFLTSLGILGGADDDDEKKQRFDEMVGEQSYSLNIFGNSYTIDWMTPSSLPLFVGHEIYNLMKDDGITLSEVFEALSGLTEPLFELSVLSGISGTIDAAKYSGSNAGIAVLWDMTTSYFTQALPTLGGQLSRIIDGQKREYYYVDKNNKYLPAAVQRLIGQAASKVPGMSYLFAPSVDEWGRDESYGGTLERVLENTVSPGYYSKENYTEVDEELLRLYNQTGDNAVFPPSISKYIKEDGERFDFTADEYASYKRDRGQRGFKYVYELMSSSSYGRMTDGEKVKAIGKCYDRAREEAKLNYLGQPIPEVIDSFGRGDAYKSYSQSEAIENGYFSSEDYDKVEINLLQLMEDNGIDNLYPTTQSNYYTSGGIKYYMTDEQHAEACQIRGKKSMELLVAFFNDENVRHGVKRYSRCKNDAEIIEAIKDIYSYAGEYTKDIMFDRVVANK